MRKKRLEILRVEWSAVNATAGWRTNHDRDTRSPAVTALGCETDNLVVAAGDEVRELHFSHRPQAHQAGADGCTDDGRFGNRSVHYAALAESLQKSGGNFERAP